MSASSAREKMKEAARRRAAETDYGAGGGSKFTLPEGTKYFKQKETTMELDVVPYEVHDPKHPDVRAGILAVGDLCDRRMIKVHNHIGPEDKSYICLDSVGEKCPICEDIVIQRKKTNSDPEELKKIAPKVRELMNVLDLDDQDKGFQFFDSSFHTFGKLLKEECEAHDDYFAFAALEGGFTIKVRFKEEAVKGRKPFLKASRIDFIPREPYTEKDLAKVINIDDALKVLTYDQLNKIYLGGAAPVEDEQEPEEERPTRRERHHEPEPEPAPRRKAAEPEPEPAPRRRAAEPEPEPAPRRRAPEPEPEPAPRRRAEPEPEPAPRRRAEPEPEVDKVHRRDPEAETASGRHSIDPEQDKATQTCPEKGGKFGVDTDKLDSCDKCKVWDDCGDEKDRRAKAAKSAPPAPEPEPERKRGGSEDEAPPRRRR